MLMNIYIACLGLWPSRFFTYIYASYIHTYVHSRLKVVLSINIFLSWFVSLDLKMAAYKNKNADKISKSVVNIVDITMTI